MKIADVCHWLSRQVECATRKRKIIKRDARKRKGKIESLKRKKQATI